jgi:hypothetical protein
MKTMKNKVVMSVEYYDKLLIKLEDRYRSYQTIQAQYIDLKNKYDKLLEVLANWEAKKDETKA